MLNKITAMTVVFSLSLLSSAYGAWQGPVKIVEGGWGSAVGQFGIKIEDSEDEFPSLLSLSPTGKILVGDSFNKRIQVFSADGTFNSMITPQGFPVTYRTITYWPLSIYVCGDNSVYTERNEYIQIYNFAGNLINNLINLDGGIVFVDQQCNFYTYNPSVKRYSVYSPTGQLIKATTTRPLELGVVNTESRGSGSYKINIKYPDKIYILASDSYFEKYVRDNIGSVYGLNSGGVWKFNQCGKEIAELIIPTEEKETISAKNAPDQSIDFDVEYGPPVVSPNGDVYTWRKSPNKYSVLKWTWVDDPNVPSGPDAPSGLTVMPSTSGLYLTWTASPSDPGCVTGYEISRATSAGGVGTTVATVNAGKVNYNDSSAVAGTMYYYKIRAVAGSEYSNYTAEVSGKK